MMGVPSISCAPGPQLGYVYTCTCGFGFTIIELTIELDPQQLLTVNEI